ncbi:MAG: HWE histidine kinase domain-containing protein [Cyanobacteria bacterium J06639_14]
MSDSSAALWDAAIAECCQEPVHTPGTVQSFGALVVTDLALETITHVSANLPQMLGLNPAHRVTLQDTQPTQEERSPSEDTPDEAWDGTGVLGQPLDTLLTGELIHELANVCGLPWISTQRERLGVHQVNGRSLHVCVHVQGDRTLIELEPSQPDVARGQNLVAHLQLRLQGNQDSRTVLAQCAEELRHATGFDRIMVYRFLPDGAGEVIAEARGDDIASFLNLRFPATDIPDLTRQILRKTALRPIPDLSAPLVPLLAWDATAAPLDLSLTSIRGASLVHIQEYLPNMGIAGSMALAITFEGKLWGLFAFHHRQPKLLSPEFRSTLELCGLLISLYLQQKLTEADFQHQQRAAKLLTQMFGQQLRTDNDWQTLVIQSLDPLCDLMSANGLALVSDRQIVSTYGDIPDNAAILSLIEATYIDGKEDNLVIESLSQYAQSGEIPQEDWGLSAGVLIVPIGFSGFNYLAFFRNETIHEVRWAGNPDGQQVVPERNVTGVQMRPQRSFEVYQQSVTGHCRPWSRQNFSLANEIREALETQVFLQERQNILIAELKHRVKNILALIRSVAHQTSRSSQSVDQYIQVLEKRIAALAMAHDFVARRELDWPPLQNLLQLELSAYLRNGNLDAPSQVTLDGPSVALNASFVPTFVLVLHELVSNAVKYGALSVPEGRLTIRWFQDRQGLTLLWREANGPTVHPPETERRGFGSDLIERAIPYEFDGETSLCFVPSGVEVNFWLPQKLVRWEIPKSPQAESPQAVSNEPEQNASIPPLTMAPADNGAVLLVEDNMLIAMEMETLLQQLGFSTIDSVPTVDRAMKYLSYDSTRYQVCLLDINLKTETSFAIAYQIAQIPIPFAFISGYASKQPIPKDLQNVPFLKKPINLGKLAEMLQTLLAEP